MTLDEFRATLTAASPPSDLSPALRVMWEEGRGNWDTAHDLAQGIGDSTGAWIHAYLHRKEGDAANAAYWYRRAGQPNARGALEEEWDQIVAALLGD